MGAEISQSRERSPWDRSVWHPRGHHADVPGRRVGGGDVGAGAPETHTPHLNKVTQSSQDDGTRLRSHDQPGTEPGPPRLSPGEARSWGEKGGYPHSDFTLDFLTKESWTQTKNAQRDGVGVVARGQSPSDRTAPGPSPQAPASHRRGAGEVVGVTTGPLSPAQASRDGGWWGSIRHPDAACPRPNPGSTSPRAAPALRLHGVGRPPRDETCQLSFLCLARPESLAGATQPSASSASRSTAPRPMPVGSVPRKVSWDGTFKFERAPRSPGSSDNAGWDSTGLGPARHPAFLPDSRLGPDHARQRGSV